MESGECIPDLGDIEFAVSIPDDGDGRLVQRKIFKHNPALQGFPCVDMGTQGPHSQRRGFRGEAGGTLDDEFIDANGSGERGPTAL